MITRILAVAALLIASTHLLAEDPPASKPAQPMDFRKLKEVMPEKLSDQPRKSSEGEKISAGEMVFSVARAEYGPKEPAENAKSIQLEIIDYTATPQMAAAMTAWQNLSIDKEGDNGFERTTKIAEQPAFERYTNDSKSGQVQLFVAGRYYVNVQASNLTADELKKLGEQLPIAKLKELK